MKTPFLPVVAALLALSLDACDEKPAAAAPAPAPTAEMTPPPFDPAHGPASTAPRKAPNWALKDLDGKLVHLSDFQGKAVLLDFWATWCPPCRAEIPGFIALQKKYAAQGLVVVGVSLDEGGPSVVSAFAKKVGIDYPIVMGTQEVAQAYGGIEGIPTTFVIDPSGNVVQRYVGGTEMAEFEKQIIPLLPKK